MLHQMFCLKYLIMFRYIFTAEKFPNNIKIPNIVWCHTAVSFSKCNNLKYTSSDGNMDWKFKHTLRLMKV